MTKKANRLKIADRLQIEIDGQNLFFEVRKATTFSTLDYCFLDLVLIDRNGKHGEKSISIYGNFDNEHEFKIMQ